MIIGCTCLFLNNSIVLCVEGVSETAFDQAFHIEPFLFQNAPMLNDSTFLHSTRKGQGVPISGIKSPLMIPAPELGVREKEYPVHSLKNLRQSLSNDEPFARALLALRVASDWWLRGLFVAVSFAILLIL